MFRLCTALQDLFQERAKIEATYSKNLHNWAKYCTAVLDNGLEFSVLHLKRKISQNIE